MGGRRSRMRSAVGVAAAALLLGGPVAVLAVSAAPAGATTFTVDPTIPDGNTNSLRDVLQNQVHDGDTVDLQPGATYTLTDCGANEITPAAAVTIVGAGATIKQTCPASGILTLQSNLTVQGVTFTGGVGDPSGGGGGAIELLASGITTSVSSSSFIGNNAGTGGGDGGAIFLSGDNDTLNVTDSTFTNNVAPDDGGAIGNEGGNPTYMIIGSTFNGNSTTGGGGSVGGAIDVEDGPGHLTMINSTVTQNTSADEAALTTEGSGTSVTLVYTDVVNNTTQGGVGAGSTAIKRSPHDQQVHTQQSATANVELEDPSLFTPFASVITGPQGGQNCSDSTGAPMTGVTSAGHNFADDTTCDLTGAGDNQAAGNNPLLGGLANNGGPTQTLLPQDGPSPLIDGVPAASCQAGPAAGVTTDQRNLPRPDTASPNCDIGAVEVQPPPAPTLTAAFTG